MSLTPQDRLKLTIKINIQTCCELLQLTPEQLLDTFDTSSFTNPQYLASFQRVQDINYISENLQECLNNLLDARKRLINLGLYHGQREAGEQEVQIRARTEIPSEMEEDRDSDNDPTSFPSDPSMEV